MSFLNSIQNSACAAPIQLPESQVAAAEPESAESALGAIQVMRNYAAERNRINASVPKIPLQDPGVKDLVWGCACDIILVSQGFFIRWMGMGPIPAIASFATTVAALYMTPGFFSWIRKRDLGQEQGGFIGRVQRIARLSGRYWDHLIKLPSPALESVVEGAWCRPQAFRLYYDLVRGHRAKEYIPWRCTRSGIIFEHLLVPEAHLLDPVLQTHCCPITGNPIREPVRDSYGNIYEESAILAWLRTGHKTEPVGSRRPLHEQDLQFMPELYNRITQRLIDLGYNDHLDL